MPKAKKLRAPALESHQARHEPLGQTIEGDQLRGKYAAPSRGRQRKRDDDTPTMTKRMGEDAEYLDDKTSKRILDMSREQQVEEEIEQHRTTWHERNKGRRHDQMRQSVRNNKSNINKNLVDDSDEEDDVEEEEIIVDDDEE